MMLGAKRRAAQPAQEQNDSSDTDSNITEDDVKRASSCQEKSLEPWPDFVKRVTHHIEDILRSTCLEDWVAQHRRRKFAFAGRTATKNDNRWSKRVLSWRPIACYGRSVGRPQRRWDDDIVQLMGGDWQTHAVDQDLWACMEEAFVHRDDILEHFGTKQKK